MRPGILHIRRERDRLPLEQRGARDIHLIVRQRGPNIGVQRDLRGRRLRDRPSRAARLPATSDKNVLRLTIGIPPMGRKVAD